MENPLFKWMIWGYHYFRKHPYTVDIWNPNDPIGPFAWSLGFRPWALEGPKQVPGMASHSHGRSVYHGRGGPLFATRTWEWLDGYLLLTMVYTYILYIHLVGVFFPIPKNMSPIERCPKGHAIAYVV